MQEPRKSWIISIGVPVIAGLLVLMGLVYGLMWLSGGHKAKASVSQEQEDSTAAAQESQPQRDRQRQPEGAASIPAPQVAQGPEGGPPPPGAAQVAQPQGQRPASQTGQAQGNAAPKDAAKEAPRRFSMKSRIENTAPEDRARQAQLRMEERAYRASHGGGGGGRGGPP